MNGIERPDRNLPVPRAVIIFIVVLALIALPLILLISLQPPFGFIQREGAKIVQIPEKINNDQDMVVSADRVTLYVPVDATDLTGNFVVTPRQPNLYSFASEPEWSRPIVVDIEYRNEEGVNYPGIIFSEPVSICFTLTPEQWNDFTKRQGDFQVQYFDNEHSPSRWVPLSMTMVTERRELCGQTDHFSIYALAIKAAEVIPITGRTLTPTVTPSPTATIFNTEESRRNQNNESATPFPTNTKPPPPTNTPRPTNTTRPPTSTIRPSNTPRPTNPPPTATKLIPTIPLPTIPPPTTEPPPTEPPPTEPPPTEPPPTEPPPTEPPIDILPIIEELLNIGPLAQ